MFTYQASGKIKFKKCGLNWVFSPLYIQYLTFDIGDRAWLRFRALEGKYQSIVVKKYRLIPSLYEGKGHSDVLYFDTFNRAYNEDDLITYEQAQVIVDAYLLAKAIDATRCPR